ncbi:hypothetical protein RJZ56_002187 [Blastomyces dermatitidis]|uniref:Cupin domain-containing protein n=2 Tax=Blastomyces TaxID=229219 RepID=A0A179UKK1_BLAGS|nr:cupin domain-containing protein [Blastomyces gilchristii SLH14081]EGE79781.1 cupin domain-containing protein [Blastomyces dermatitidis ATCC 18188]OAT07749.1 cupin domain-containing protein [Blastomyces gilchristii SLH14081]
MTTNLTPLSSLQVTRQQIPPWRHNPNTSIQHKPLSIYHGAFKPTATAFEISQHLTKIGVVEPQWIYSMYPYSHLHTTTHEVLSIVSGKAKLCFGHEDNPERFEAVVAIGDVIVVPAGLAHRLLEDIEGGFKMIGAYPRGKEWDMCYGSEEEGDKSAEIRKVSWFERDPLYGDRGPVLDM